MFMAPFCKASGELYCCTVSVAIAVGMSSGNTDPRISVDIGEGRGPEPQLVTTACSCYIYVGSSVWVYLFCSLTTWRQSCSKSGSVTWPLSLQLKCMSYSIVADRDCIRLKEHNKSWTWILHLAFSSAPKVCAVEGISTFVSSVCGAHDMWASGRPAYFWVH